MPSALLKVGKVLLDAAVIALCVAAIAHFARRRTIDCKWERLRASCAVATVDSIGRVEHEDIEGIRGAAYRSGTVVGLVTDAQHKGEHALFGTHEVELGDPADAERLRSFASDRDTETLSIASGVLHPRLFTLGLFACLVVYGAATRRRRARS